MKKSIYIFLLLLVGVSAFARIIHVWTEDEMLKASQLVVVGTVADVTDLDETNTTLWPPWKFIGMETTFKVSKVIKGDFTNSTVALHYYRIYDVDPANGPSFIHLTPTDTNQFLLYLVPDGASRFAPVSGQIDPAEDAVRIFGQPPFDVLKAAAKAFHQ